MVVKSPRPGNAPRTIAQLNRPLLTQTQASVRMYQRSAVSQPTLAITAESVLSDGFGGDGSMHFHRAVAGLAHDIFHAPRTGNVSSSAPSEAK